MVTHYAMNDTGSSVRHKCLNLMTFAWTDNLRENKDKNVENRHLGVQRSPLYFNNGFLRNLLVR